MITSIGLNHLATSFKDKVSTVLLNDSTKVSNFYLEEISQNTYTLELDVPSGVTQITNFKLLDQQEAVIANNNLFVPVESDVRFKYVLTFNSAR